MHIIYEEMQNLISKTILVSINDYNVSLGLGYSLKVLFSRGIAKYHLENFKSAIGDFSETIAEEDDIEDEIDRQTFAYRLTWRAKARVKIFEFNDAILDFNTAINTDSTYYGAWEAYDQRGSLKYLLHDFKGAIEDFTKVIYLNPLKADARLYYTMGAARLFIIDTVGAIRDFTKAIIVDPKYLDAYNYRANLKFYLKDFRGVINDCNEIIKLDPKNKDGYFFRAWAKNEIKDFLGAISDFNFLISIDKKNATAYQMRGASKHELGDYRGAIIDYDQAISIEPQDETSFFDRGLSNLRLNLKEAACLDFSKAGELGLKSAYEEIKKSCN